jgi:hypothetical protein
MIITMTDNYTDSTVVEGLGKVLAVKERLQNSGGKNYMFVYVQIEREGERETETFSIGRVPIFAVLTDVILVWIVKSIDHCRLGRPFFYVAQNI